MAVTPNSKVRLHRQVPLDVEHVNTILFKTESAQRKYFDTKDENFGNLTYVRQNDGEIRLGLSADVAYTCNYMSFQNTNYGSKWFYAFITSVDYLNDNACVVHYKIDVIQTYMFDYSLPMCYVIREHASTDTIGENLQPEPVNLGDYVVSESMFYNVQCCVCVASSVEYENLLENPKPVGVGYYSGLLQGIDILTTDIVMPPSNREDANREVEKLKQILDNYTQNNASDSIVSLFNAPYAVCHPTNDEIEKGMGYFKPLVRKTGANIPTTLDGYKPRNKKLLTYPYCYLAVDTGSGCANYRFEYFPKRDAWFNMYYTLNCNPEVSCVPLNYNGIKEDFANEIKMSNFGQVPFSIDTYKAWLAQNGTAWNLKMAQATYGGVTTAVGGLVNAFHGDLSGINASVNSAFNIMNVANEKAMAENQAPHARGIAQSDVDLVSNGKGFFFKTMSMRSDFAQRADEYFDMFGYATNRLKVPNITSRKEWNYVQTSAINIYGSIPNDACAEISNIYNRGIRFWHHASHVGDYTLDNSIK